MNLVAYHMSVIKSKYFYHLRLLKIYPKAVRMRTNKGSLIGQVISKITWPFFNLLMFCY